MREHRLAAGPREAFPAERVAVALTLAGLAAAVVLGWLSEGVYHDDEIAHFRFAQEGWTDVGSLLHWWARPGYNIPAMFVVRAFWVMGGGDVGFAFFGCRLFSAVQTAAAAYLAYRIARLLAGPTLAAAIAPAMVWIQPMVMTLAMTTLTETPAALYLTLGVWLYLRGNRVWACVAISPTFLTRIETLALAPILGAALVIDALRGSAWGVSRAMRTRWLWAAVAALAWAPAAYCAAVWAASLPAYASPLAMFERAGSGAYGTGPWLHYLQIWPEAAGLGVLTLAVAGAIRLGRKGGLICVLVGALVALHTVLYRYGLFASGGYSRFLVPAAPLVAVLASVGLAAALRGGRRPAVVAIFVAAPVWVLLAARGLAWAIARYPEMLRDPAVAAMPPVLGMVVLTVAVLAAILLALNISRPGEGPRRSVWPARAAVAALLAMNAAQLAVQARPLSPRRSAEHAVIARAVHHVRQGPHAGSPALTLNGLPPFLRPKIRVSDNLETAVEDWRRAPAGTLFLWDSKYCRDEADPRAAQSLRDELRRLGERIFRAADHGKSAEVFVRKRANAATRPGR